MEQERRTHPKVVRKPLPGEHLDSETRLRAEAMIVGAGEDLIQGLLLLTPRAVNSPEVTMTETPQRFMTFWKNYVIGEPFDLTIFEDQETANGYEGMLVKAGIQVFSFCEHHILPFVGEAIFGYLPGKGLLGLSKIPRLIRMCASGLRTQESLTTRVLDIFEEYVQPRGCGLYINARHFCECYRGVREPFTDTTTVSVRGAFKDDRSTKAEWEQHWQIAAMRSRLH